MLIARIKLIIEPMLKAPYILLAEDSDDDAFFAHRCFRIAGVKVDLKRCENGVDACADLKRCGADLPLGVILDLKMPLMDGFETLKWIRDQPGFKHLPVVILSSSDIPEDKKRAQKLGCTEYLVKPNSIKALEALLKELVERLLARATVALSESGSVTVKPGRTP
ncbi:MAG TPA: response regulator [Verrucomicrobiae bacterium]